MYGKTKEILRNRINTKLVNNEKTIENVHQNRAQNIWQ